MMTKIIAISGKKGSGKTSSAEFIRRTYEEKDIISLDQQFNIYSFASPLKEIAVNILGLPYSLVYGTQQDKETLTTIRGRDLYEFSKVLYRLSSTHPLERFTYLRENDILTVRDVLKILGNFFRAMNEDCWVNAVLHKIREDNPKIALIDDMRFLNEANKIKLKGGKVIRLTRQIDQDEDISETSLDDYTEFDEVIENHNMTINERNKCLDEFMVEVLKPY